MLSWLQVQEALQPMQQVMAEAEGILGTEPKVGFNIGQAKEELIKVNVSTKQSVFLRNFSFRRQSTEVHGCVWVFVNRNALTCWKRRK